MKTLADLLEVIWENGLIISNPKPQASDSLPSTSTEDCFYSNTPRRLNASGNTPRQLNTSGNTSRRLNKYSCGREKPMHLSPKSRFPYQPVVEPITPIKVKKGLKVKNPGFKRHRNFRFHLYHLIKE